MTGNRWLAKIEEDPDHSDRYVERFRTMAADGADLHGEPRFVDAMVGRGARILDGDAAPADWAADWPNSATTWSVSTSIRC